MGAELSLEQLVQVFPQVDRTHLGLQLDLLNAAAVEAQVCTASRWAMFLAQLGVECDSFTKFEENLNYSAAALLATWPSHFDAALAAQYARQPVRIANRAYANRHGNGDEQSGDGWRYRGRGAIGLTFFDNYSACGTFLGLDLRARPELASGEARFMVAAWYWRVNGCNALADLRDVPATTKRVNGGAIGLAQRQALYTAACLALGVN